MKMTEEMRGEVLTVRPEGRIDTISSEELGSLLASRLDGALRRLVIDMSGTDYISSAGLRVLLLALKKLRGSGGQLALGGLNPSVKQIFDLAGFSAMFALEPDADRAVARVSGGG